MKGRREFSGKNIEVAKTKAAKALGIDVQDLVIESVNEQGGFLFGKKITIEVRDVALKQGGEQEFLETLLKNMHVTCQVTRREEDERIILCVNSNDGGLLIGKNGAVLESLQYLLNKAAGRMKWSEKPVLIDVEDYRERKLKQLQSKAERIAQRVIESGKPFTLEPLNSYERRAVHLALRNYPGISSQSIGNGALRKIKITNQQAQSQ